MILRKFCRAAWGQLLVIVVQTLMLSCIVAAITSCRTCKQQQSSDAVKYVYAADSLQNVSLRIDSVFVKDSVFTFVKGDSVLITHYRDSYRDRLRIDTVVKLKTRTVYITRTERITARPERRPRVAIMTIILLGVTAYLIGKLLALIYWKFCRRK